MKKVKITVIKITTYNDLIEKYENKSIKNSCMMNVGDTFIIDNLENIPNGFCLSAYNTILPYLMTLLSNGHSIYDDWMKNPKSAIVSCSDGCRPVSFLLEVID